MHHPKAEAANKNPYGYGKGVIWPYGKENWCNLEGRYLHIVADMNNLMTQFGQINANICTLGVFGTKYVRDGAALTASITLYQG